MKTMPKTLWVFTFLFLLSELRVEGRYDTCPKHCHCYRNPGKSRSPMDCDGKKNSLHTIPRAPSYVNTVQLTNIQLGYVTKEMTDNLTHCNMTSLTLMGNNITGISGDAFQNLTFLETLIWQQDQLPLEDFPQLFLNTSRSLQKLTLKCTAGVSDKLDSVMFKGLQSLTQLTLNLLELKIFNATSLSELRNLVNLDLFGNRIVSIILEKPIPNLKKVNLQGNNLVEVPRICRDGTSLMPRLRDLNLRNNAIRELDVSTLTCLHNLLKLTLSQNRIEHLRDNVFSNLLKLESLQMTNLWALKSIENLAFNSSSLMKLVFTDNPALHLKNFHPETLFKYMPKLESLDMSNTNLNIHVENLKSLFMNLRNIQKLILQSVDISQLPPGLFSQMKELTDLTLSGNRISSWNRTIFANVTSIKRISLASNKIKIITEDFFPPEFRQSVKEINLALNPFTCTCDLLWFKNWMDEVMANKSIQFIQYPERYDCKSLNAKPLKLKDFKPTVKSCSITQPYTVILTIILSVCLVFTVAALVTYRYRWYILYWISLMRRRRQRQDQQAEIRYDGFVSYSNPDWDWVSSELIDYLEGPVELQLCEHSRDFKAGMYIVDNVIEAMNTSRKTILVISNEYMKSDWCQFELKMTLSSFLQKEIDIVVILLEHIKSSHVTSSLRALMVSTTYTEWSDDQEAKRLFREKLKNAMTDRH